MIQFILAPIGEKLAEVFVGKIVTAIDPVTGAPARQIDPDTGDYVRQPPKLQTPAQDARPAIKAPSVQWAVVSPILIGLFWAGLAYLGTVDWTSILPAFPAVLVSAVIQVLLRLKPPSDA